MAAAAWKKLTMEEDENLMLTSLEVLWANCEHAVQGHAAEERREIIGSVGASRRWPVASSPTHWARLRSNAAGSGGLWRRA
ncbi:MAG: hypothetical protein ACPIOQ_18320 [Promethearchaeia archaeon]